MTKLYLAIPCYNEEEVLRDSAEKLLNKYSTMMAEGKISADSRIVFIGDGSKDTVSAPSHAYTAGQDMGDYFRTPYRKSYFPGHQAFKKQRSPECTSLRSYDS